MDLPRFKKLPILGIIRSSADVPVEELVESAVSSGLKALEIAMNSRSAGNMLARASRASRGRIDIGAGTVTDKEVLITAIDSGATFIVMPVTISSVIEYCAVKRIPVFPGALTPKEIFDAWKSGATMVKVFPAGAFGPGYFKEIKGPFNNIDLMACGGVSAGNIREYLSSGASAVAFGSSVFKEELIVKRDYKTIERSMRDLISAAGF